MQSADQAQLHMLIGGRVQGVFFRAATAEEARALGLKGWVRNLPDGRVEVVAEGDRKNLEMLYAWAHHGPRYARVSDVQAQWSEYSGRFRDFEIR